MKYKNYLFVFFRTVLPASIALFLALACHQFGVVYFRVLVSMNIDLAMHLKADTANSPTMQNRRFFLSLHSFSACLPAVTMCDMSHCLVPVWHIKKLHQCFAEAECTFRAAPKRSGCHSSCCAINISRLPKRSLGEIMQGRAQLLVLIAVHLTNTHNSLSSISLSIHAPLRKTSSWGHDRGERPAQKSSVPKYVDLK